MAGKDATLSILFVCAGNIMRSVISECLLGTRATELLGDRGVLISAQSCGLEAEQDAAPHGDAVAALEYLGIPLVETTASRADGGHLRQCDIAITMTRQQSYILAGRFPDQMRKCFSMLEINGAIETLLEAAAASPPDDPGAVAAAAELPAEDLSRGLRLAALALQNAPRELMRPLPGVPLGIVELLTLFSPCFYQVSAVHDPIGGGIEETYRCARLLDEQVTLLARGLLVLAASELDREPGRVRSSGSASRPGDPRA